MWYGLHPNLLERNNVAEDDDFLRHVTEVFGYNPLEIPDEEWDPYFGSRGED